MSQARGVRDVDDRGDLIQHRAGAVIGSLIRRSRTSTASTCGASRISRAASGPQNFSRAVRGVVAEPPAYRRRQKATVTMPMITSLPEMPVVDGRFGCSRVACGCLLSACGFSILAVRELCEPQVCDRSAVSSTYSRTHLLTSSPTFYGRYV